MVKNTIVMAFLSNKGLTGHTTRLGLYKINFSLELLQIVEIPTENRYSIFMENIILRKQYLDKIRPFYDSKYIKAITGIRRCGKSELIKQIVEEIKDSGIDEKHIIVLNLEGRSGEGITTRLKLEKKLDSLITDKEKYYIFIDEVQHIKIRG